MRAGSSSGDGASVTDWEKTASGAPAHETHSHQVFVVIFVTLPPANAGSSVTNPGRGQIYLYPI
jgi:hypothetical protein